MTPHPPQDLINRILSSGLRGRGGGWYPTGKKWQAVAAEGGEPCIVGNGAEGEPGSIKDRFVMRRRPELVLRGLQMAAQALGARQTVLYLRGSFNAEARALEGALSAGVDGLEVRLFRGEEGYIAGEETAVLETLEGRRAWPRPKPPLPSAVGLEGRPTLVQNVETLSLVPAAVDDPEAFRRSEKTLVSLWGHVRRPGVYEIRLGTPLQEIIDRCGEGAPEGVGLLFPGGPSASPLRPEETVLPLDPEALRGAGSGLGTGSFLVLKKNICPLAAGVSLASFFERESCQQCPPCSVGTSNLARILRALEDGIARPPDLRALSEAAGFMSIHGYCAHGRTAAAAVGGLLARFPETVEEHLRSGCPKGPQDPFGAASPERAAIERALLEVPGGPSQP
jgi:NADH-quinone oxidoreductase subunit F